MARFLTNMDQFSLEEQIKVLGDEELLDFWEETQFISRLMDDGNSFQDAEISPEYERLILQELQVRSCRRTLD